jgi:hypothetical protein
MTQRRLASKPLRWPDEAAGPWQTEVEYGVVGGRVECVGLRVTSVSGDMRLTSADLRKMPFADLLARARRDYPDDLERLLGLGPFIKVGDLQRLGLGLLADKHRGRPPSWGPEQLAELANVYLRASAASPTKAVADHFHISRSAAAKLVAKARQAGLLAPTSRGKVSGATTTRRSRT